MCPRVVACPAREGQKADHTPCGFEGEWPDEVIITVTFEDDGAGTRVTVRHAGLSAAFVRPAETGWRESLDKLGEALRQSTA